MNTTILWHDRDTLGAECCTLSSLGSGFRLAGTALCPVDGVPLQVAYTVVVDADWHTRQVAVHVDMPHTVAAGPQSRGEACDGTMVSTCSSGEATIAGELLRKEPQIAAVTTQSEVSITALNRGIHRFANTNI